MATAPWRLPLQQRQYLYRARQQATSLWAVTPAVWQRVALTTLAAWLLICVLATLQALGPPPLRLSNVANAIDLFAVPHRPQWVYDAYVLNEGGSGEQHRKQRAGVAEPITTGEPPGGAVDCGSYTTDRLKVANDTSAGEGLEKRRHFVMLTSEKSGSTWLIRKFGEHPEIVTGVNGTLRRLSLDGAFGPQGDLRDIQTVTWEDWGYWVAESLRALDRKVVAAAANQAPTATRVKAVGYKVMYNHIPNTSLRHFANWAACNDVTVVHVTRNVLMSYLSWQTEQVEKWVLVPYLHWKEKSRPHYNGKLWLGPVATRQYVLTVERNRELFHNLLSRHSVGVPYLSVQYEQLANGDDKAHAYLRTIFNHLGVDPSGSAPDTKQKRHHGGCEGRINNWQQLRGALEHTDALLSCEGTH